jgi:hypothetical protein
LGGRFARFDSAKLPFWGLSSLPFIELFPVSDGFDPDVILFIDKKNDPIDSDSQQKFALQITEELFPGQKAGRNKEIQVLKENWGQNWICLPISARTAPHISSPIPQRRHP